MESTLSKSNTTIDKFFIVRDFIQESDVPVSIIQISDATGFGIRTIQRFAMRLATEGLVNFKGSKSNSYVYYGIGKGEKYES